MSPVKFAELKKSRRSIRSIDHLVKGYGDLRRLSRKNTSMTPILDEGDRENGTTLFKTQNEGHPLVNIEIDNPISNDQKFDISSQKLKHSNNISGVFDDSPKRYVQSNIDNGFDFSAYLNIKNCKTSVDLKRSPKNNYKNKIMKKDLHFKNKRGQNKFKKKTMKVSHPRNQNFLSNNQFSTSPDLKNKKINRKLPLNSKAINRSKWMKSKRKIPNSKQHKMIRSQISPSFKTNTSVSRNQKLNDYNSRKKRPRTAHPQRNPRPGTNSPRIPKSQMRARTRNANRNRKNQSKHRSFNPYDSSLGLKKKKLPKKSPRDILQEAREKERENKKNKLKNNGNIKSNKVKQISQSMPRGPTRSKSRPYTYRETPLYPEEEMRIITEGVKGRKQEIMDTFAALNLDMAWVHKQSRNVDLDTGKGLLHFFDLQNRLIVKLATKLRKEKNSRYHVEKQCQTMVDKFSKKI